MQENMRYVRSQGKVFAFVGRGIEGEAKGQLVGTNGMGSVLCVSSMGSGSNLMHYGPYGSRSGARSAIAYNGERADRICEDYALGNGYRSYSPVLMRFRSPDSWSPFGQGGINAYAYCSADPINNRDPSGHMSGSAIAGITLGTLGILMSVFTIGMGAPLTASAIAGLVLGLTADVMGITSLVLEDTNPQASGVIGWVALGFGLVSLGLTTSGPLKKLITSRGSNSTRFNDNALSVHYSGNVQTNDLTSGYSAMHIIIQDLQTRHGELFFNEAVVVKFKLGEREIYRVANSNGSLINAKDFIHQKLGELGCNPEQVSTIKVLNYDTTREFPTLEDYSHSGGQNRVDRSPNLTSLFGRSLRQHFPNVSEITSANIDLVRAKLMRQNFMYH